MPEHDPAQLMRLITEEIWNRRRLELVDELIAEDLVDHVDIPSGPRCGHQHEGRLLDWFAYYHDQKPMLRFAR
jgi:hypothetical protein